MLPDKLEIAVVGAGVIGLAIARRLALQGREVVVLEAERAPGMHTSSRNSEVIHAGFYYPTGSLKARLCVAGRRQLYAYAEKCGVAFSRLGKLVVATSDEEAVALESYLARGEANGVEGLSLLSPAEARELEPQLHCLRALHSAETGIIDSHALMRALRRDAEAHGASLALEAPVVGGAVGDSSIVLQVSGDTVRCGAVVNAAGLRAQELARSLAGVPLGSIPPSYYARGQYFVLSGTSPFRRLIYPVARGAGLGVHLTLDLQGRARFGPDVEWIDRIDYGVDESRAPAFAAAVRRYWPGLPDRALQPGYAGIRPKLVPAGTEAADFVIQGPADHGVPGLVNLYGIESPGLTASLAIADYAASLLH